MLSGQLLHFTQKFGRVPREELFGVSCLRGVGVITLQNPPVNSLSEANLALCVLGQGF